MAKDTGSAENPPLPTRNLSRLVANLKAIAERRKRQQQHQLLGGFNRGTTWRRHWHQCLRQTSPPKKTPRQNPHRLQHPTCNDLPPNGNRKRHHRPVPFQATGSLDETVANPEAVVRYKGRLPCEVSLAELTAEFRALSVVALSSERRQKEIQAESINSQWRQLQRGDAEYQSMVPSQMWVSPAQDEAAEDLSGAQTRQNDPPVRPAIPASGPDSLLFAGGVLDPSWNWTTTRLTVGFVRNSWICYCCFCCCRRRCFVTCCYCCCCCCCCSCLIDWLVWLIGYESLRDGQML